MHYPIRVLFLCTGNSARSQMAEGLLRAIGGGDFEINSGGTDPKGLNPLAIEAMRESGIDISGHQSKSLERFLGQHFDYIITVCDRARDSCPTFPGDNQRIHWGFEDPAAVSGSRAEQLAVFRRVRNEISERLRVWVTVQRKRMKDIDQSA
jgi:arsenate reductase